MSPTNRYWPRRLEVLESKTLAKKDLGESRAAGLGPPPSFFLSPFCSGSSDLDTSSRLGQYLLVADLLILGGGAVGLATAWAASRRGARVRVLERHSSPNELSSHHGETRMIRCSYAEHPDYVALARRAWETWRELDAAGGAPVLHATGGLYVGPLEGAWLSGALASARAHDLPHELLDAAALRQRLPPLRLPAGCAAMLEPGAGFLRCELALRRFAALARAAGVEIVEGARVTSLIAEADGRPCARTDDGAEHRAAAVVDARGPGMAEAGLPWPLQVTRQLLGWFETRDAAALREGSWPVWAVDAAAVGGPAGGLLYGFPILQNESLLKAAWHAPGPTILPYSPEPARLAEVRDAGRALAELLPGRTGAAARAVACQYTMSPDGHFLVDRHPSGARGVAAAGLSGHGFKFAPVLGQALAEMALDGGTALPVGFLAARRLAPPPQRPA